jgi:hypothetical protein
MRHHRCELNNQHCLLILTIYILVTSMPVAGRRTISSERIWARLDADNQKNNSLTLLAGTNSLTGWVTYITHKILLPISKNAESLVWRNPNSLAVSPLLYY